MNNIYKSILITLLAVAALSCTDKYEESSFSTFKIESVTVGEVESEKLFNRVDIRSDIKLVFSEKVDETTIEDNITLRDKNKAPVKVKYEFDGDKTVTLKPEKELRGFYAYDVVVQPQLKSAESKWDLYTGKVYNMNTFINTDDKFPRIPQEELLDLVQKTTFKYFWDHAEPNSGMARERNNSGTLVTTGGTGFGVMAIIVGVERGYITRAEATTRVQQIVTFLDTKATKYQGAYSHWIDGQSGASKLFGTLEGDYKDEGADLVETALLFQGLLSAKSYFKGADAAETALRADIQRLYEAVEWNKFVQNASDLPCSDASTLMWHWNPKQGFSKLKITGWNESLIVYVLAASSPTHPINNKVYQTGWTKCGDFINGMSYYGIDLPLGPEKGGPLFLDQYSFLGLNPTTLKDQYTSYWTQVVNHALINRAHSIENPNNKPGYGKDVWGLTASDNPKGYSAHSPMNDNGTIAPTAAISSMPFLPKESMEALEFFYYKLGDKVWTNEFGFKDAFNLGEDWVAAGHIAIDQGPQIIMIENYRTGLLWNTFMELPEIQTGLTNLGFTY